MNRITCGGECSSDPYATCETTNRRLESSAEARIKNLPNFLTSPLPSLVTHRDLAKKPWILCCMTTWLAEERLNRPVKSSQNETCWKGSPSQGTQRRSQKRSPKKFQVENLVLYNQRRGPEVFEGGVSRRERWTFISPLLRFEYNQTWTAEYSGRNSTDDEGVQCSPWKLVSKTTAMTYLLSGASFFLEVYTLQHLSSQVNMLCQFVLPLRRDVLFLMACVSTSPSLN